MTNTTMPGVNGGPDVRAYVAMPEGEGPFPTMIMIHEFYALNEAITSKADLLAQEGYVVVAPDTFRG
ncbi:MAG: dienelactone hydrolase family protein [Chloroflexi bacterium]|nr:dienelactone hydrolase family protein [Chloroflexota bacterium]